jgi:putative phosphoribosyl transferase
MFTATWLFEDRADAGRQLARAVEDKGLDDPLVMALPRGGVPVAYEIAVHIAAPLEILIVRKIGAPGHEEFGLGALVDGEEPELVLNRRAIRLVRPPKGYLEAELRSQVDRIVCLATPFAFRAVGLYYRNFEQTADEEVLALMEKARLRNERN